MARGQFTFYRSFYAALGRIKAAGARAAAYDAIAEYALDGKEPDMDKLSEAAAIAFELIRPTLDAASRKSDGAKKGQQHRKSTRNPAEKDSKIPPRCAQDTDKLLQDSGNKKEGESKKEKENKKENEYENEGEKENKSINAAAAAGCGQVVPIIRHPQVIADFCDRINPAASPRCLAELDAFADAVGEAVCSRAMDIALDAKKASWPYVRAILRSKQAAGVTCLADWEALEGKRQEQTDDMSARHAASPMARAAVQALLREAEEG